MRPAADFNDIFVDSTALQVERDMKWKGYVRFLIKSRIAIICCTVN